MLQTLTIQLAVDVMHVLVQACGIVSAALGASAWWTHTPLRLTPFTNLVRVAAEQMPAVHD